MSNHPKTAASLTLILILAATAARPEPLIAQTKTTRQPARPSSRRQKPVRKTPAPQPATEETANPAEPAQRKTPRQLPGLQDAGEILLPNQWSLRPAGKQIKLGDFPVNVALHPSQPWAAVLHAGYGEHEIAIVDLKRQRVTSRASLEQSFYGLCFDPDGNRLFASGAEFEVVHQFDFADGYLSEHRQLAVGDPQHTHVPAGITCDASGKTLYVACAWGHTLCVIPLDRPDDRKHIPLGDGSAPYASLASADGKRLFVSLWGQAAVAVLDLESLQEVGRWETASHPTELALSPDGQRLFVACANSNSVSVLDTVGGQPLETVSSAMHAQAPNGSTPNSLSLSPDGKVLLIANADNNNVALFDVSQPGKSRSLGHIPCGWYPTSVRYGAQDNRIYVANGKGLMSQANPQGPNPNLRAPANIEQYIGGLFRGTLSVIDAPSPQEMGDYTQQARQCSPLPGDETAGADPADKDNPIPAEVGQPSPIEHCLYIIKENRTYDQVFGDMPEGNGDAALCIFPEDVTPNHHALARQFVLLDNFYVESEVSADGHEWSMAAYATDFVEKTWPLVYRGGQKKLQYPAEGHAPLAESSGGYIWDRCAAAGVSYRSYGEFIANGKLGEPAIARVKALEGHFDPQFRGYDLDYPDSKRADRFIAELQRFEAEGQLPRFIVLRLPNDHTYGMSAGKPTPTAMVADNDLALGRVVEAFTRTSFWNKSAIFVVEDDAQNGSDHVDAHRTVALVISPYARRGVVDSSMYSTSSMLRTMELILGLQPMSQFDAAARPMRASFRSQSDPTPYEHLPARADLAATNPRGGWAAEQSARLDFSREDAADDLLLNQIVWQSVRGPDARMPAPVRASFVLARGDEDDDDDEEGDEEDDGDLEDLDRD